MLSKRNYYLILFSPIPVIMFKSFSLGETASFILFNIRLPRILLCALAGATLSVAGASLQSTLRNPLVSPYILGLSQGAAFGAALAMLLLPYSSYMIPILAFIFGFSAVILACSLARIRGGFSTVTVILAGVIVAAIFTALLSIVKFISDPYRLSGIVFWTMGGFYKASWDYLLLAAPGSVTGLTILFFLRWRLNVLSMGDEEAKLMGVNVYRERLLVLISATLACASVISVSGIVAWVGLIVPHIVRSLVGSDNKYLIPASAAFGASILVLTDDLCRSLFSFEIPISIVTTLVAAPYFIYLLRKVGGEWR
jgi:iron complex transport system permease protein